ncbi:acyl-CoA thioesterase [Nitriliruptor alkaliphilus]|uniref:acyl-CoA thioesterase n=1 Tax=Nitriliruptor alkaliphilus TaxID=427918 RepID=UPI0006976D32|nr:acyl-CoA thioesterase [Nitriliruptor alkaliphilus]
MDDPTTDRSYYRHVVDEQVRFSDTDALGHVNNVAVAALVESGRVAFAMDLLTHAGARETSDAVAGLVLVRLEIDFRAELRYPAKLTVASRLVALGRTSLTVATGVFEGRRCAATARGVLVVVGTDGPRPIPADVRAALEQELP